MAFNYFYPLLDDYMTSCAMDKPKMLRMRAGEDCTKIENMMTRH